MNKLIDRAIIALQSVSSKNFLQCDKKGRLDGKGLINSASSHWIVYQSTKGVRFQNLLFDKQWLKIKKSGSCTAKGRGGFPSCFLVSCNQDTDIIHLHSAKINLMRSQFFSLGIYQNGETKHAAETGREADGQFKPVLIQAPIFNNNMYNYQNQQGVEESSDDSDEEIEQTESFNEKADSNIELSNKMKTVKSNKTLWGGARGTRVYDSGVHKIKFSIDALNGSYTATMIGVVSDKVSSGVNYKNAKGYMFYATYNGNKYNNGSNSAYGEKCVVGDNVEILLDMDCKTISFIKNGKDLGIAYSDLPESVVLAVDLYESGNQISLVDSIRITKETKISENSFNMSRKDPFIALSNRMKTVTGTKTAWAGVRGNRVYDSGIHRIKFSIDTLNGSYTATMIGVVSDKVSSGVNYKNAKGYMFYATYNGNKYNNGVNSAYGEKCVVGDNVEILLDMDCKTISFIKNGKDLGIAYSDLPESVVLAVDIYESGNQITLVKSKTILEKTEISENSFNMSRKDPFIALSNKMKTVTGTKTAWAGVRGNRVYHSGIHKIKFSIDALNGSYTATMIGVVSDKVSSGVNYKNPKGYMFYATYNGNKYNNGSNSAYGEKCVVGDNVEILLDMDKKTISFIKNGKDLGIAYSNLPESVVLAVDIYESGNQITLLDSNQF
ncbi:spry domain containing socs box protein [Anaeramoeba flamelloides]|uniref:Spry domain containing socs box protein n=1 Tax=Anaeramoeba flamelloides TaxID=1746091 RepID=A0ABQ8XGH4_9EUKA|nr:spry domain containing socs box protein [Anaeramoeba flamelloides]